MKYLQTMSVMLVPAFFLLFEIIMALRIMEVITSLPNLPTEPVDTE